MIDVRADERRRRRRADRWRRELEDGGELSPVVPFLGELVEDAGVELFGQQHGNSCVSHASASCSTAQVEG